MDSPSANIIATLLHEAAHRFILPRFRCLEQNQIIAKKPDDLVTVADIETEEWLKEKLTEIYPHSLFLGEESVYHDPDLQNRILKASYDKAVWIVDPIDGTNNFTKGLETYCSMIAFAVKQEVQMAWIYDPKKDTVIHAVKDKGLFQDGIPYKPKQNISNTKKGNISFKRLPLSVRNLLKQHRDKIDDITNLHCAGQDYLSMIHSESDFSLSFDMKPWDHSPGVFMLQEAGGKTINLAGSSYTPLDNSGLILSMSPIQKETPFPIPFENINI